MATMSIDEELLPPLPTSRNLVVTLLEVSSLPLEMPEDDLFPVVVGDELYTGYHLDLPSLVDHQYFFNKEATPAAPKPSRLKLLKKGIRKLSLTPKRSAEETSFATASVTLVTLDQGLAKLTKLEKLAKLTKLKRSRHNSVVSSVSADLAKVSPPLLSLLVLRQRAALVVTSITPPLLLPVITFLDGQAKLTDYFDGRQANRVAELVTAEELMEYLAFLVSHRQLMMGAFDATHLRLQKLGWCTDNDLDNIQLQQQLSLEEIDGMLHEIDIRLTHEFGMRA